MRIMSFQIHKFYMENFNQIALNLLEVVIFLKIDNLNAWSTSKKPSHK